MRKKILLILVALLAFESFGFCFLLDAAKFAIGVSVKAVQNKRKFPSVGGVSLTPGVYTFRTK